MEKKIFFSNDSSGEVGSMCASMNRTGKANAKKGPKVDFNTRTSTTEKLKPTLLPRLWNLLE